MTRTLQACLLAALAAGIAWGIGFTLFVQAARQPAPAATIAAPIAAPIADGIVALTGGAARIDTALRLLENGRAPLLLISGVGRGSDLPEIARRAQLDPATISHNITLGRSATSTRGNAEETANWARAHAIGRLIVVTAGYHMPRALLEIARRIPETTLYPVPVQPPAMRGDTDPATLRLLATEYDKFLAVKLGLSSLMGKEVAR